MEVSYDKVFVAFFFIDICVTIILFKLLCFNTFQIAAMPKQKIF